jgi:hypothetical protein
MLLRLQLYDINLIYRPGKQMDLADTLSRAPLSDNNVSTVEREIASINMLQFLPMSEPGLSSIRVHTANDATLQAVTTCIQTGWSTNLENCPTVVLPYWNQRHQLCMQDGIMFRGDQVVIPELIRRDMLSRIHSSHIGIEGCLRRARESLYWPGMSSNVKDFVSKCEICCTYTDKQQKETLHPHDVPDRPWAKVGIDLFTFDDKQYMVTVDYYSNFIEVDWLPDTKSKTVIYKLKAQFARYGIPDIVMSDNGPQYASEDFKKFATDWNIEHVTSSPTFAQSNGKAEQAVKTAKALMRKAKSAKHDPYLALLDFRNTPTQGMDSSPAQRLMSRRTKTLLPTSGNLLKPRVPAQVSQQIKANKDRMAKYYNRVAKDLPPLSIGDTVRIQPSRSHDHEWTKGTVTSTNAGIRSYDVITDNNTVLRRNRKHLRKSNETECAHGSNDPDDNSVTARSDNIEQQSVVQENSFSRTPPVSAPAPDNVTTATTTRSGRARKPPRWMKDFITK